jgi:hypothetical protein
MPILTAEGRLNKFFSGGTWLYGMIIKELVSKIFMRLAFALCVIFFLSCNPNNNTEIATTETGSVGGENPIKDSTVVANNIDGCYMKILKRDTMLLHLQQNGKMVSGKMNFDNYEKDGSTGTVTGVIENDIVKLWYNFQSEGMNSVMQLYFKVVDSSMLQGVGPMENKADTAYFTNHSKIDYSKDQALNKIDCAEVDKKYL